MSTPSQAPSATRRLAYNGAYEVVAVGSRQLTPSQRSALAFVAEQGRAGRGKAKETLAHVAKMSNIADDDLAEAVQEIQTRARVALHFHPDRPVSGSETVAERLLAEGTYRSQFESKISNGSVSAYPGGERDLWEQQLFGGAYQRPECHLRERPKYGSLDLVRHSDGPSPRFGSCYLLLDPLVTQRCTFTYLDSNEKRDEKGTLAEFDAVLAALFRESFYRNFAIGEPGLTPTGLVTHLRSELQRSTSVTAQRAPTRNLNHYIEAQVHGDVLLGEDAQALVADPSFRGSDTGAALQELATQYAVDLYWHRGFELEVANVPRDFRGPTMPSLAARVASSDSVNAREIGAAVRSLERDPDAWADRGTRAEVLQELKLLWHCAVKFGSVSGAVAT